MVKIPEGELAMGDAIGDGMPWERPVHVVRISAFYIDRFEVTNAQFEAFVAATRYVTTAEMPIPLDAIMRQLPPGTPPPPPDALKPAALVFTKTSRPVPLGQPGVHERWWRLVPGADWRHPNGPEDTIEKKAYYPVVQVSWEDAAAYCKWAGRRLPTEGEWERAARGGLEKKRFTWGDDAYDAGARHGNIWQGSFPHENTREDGYEGVAPVGQFAPNGFGLFDMAGNVWEWVSDWYRADTYAKATPGERDPRGPDTSLDPDEPTIPKRVVRGGSFLCTTTYCSSFRPSARMKTSPDSASNHQGFRCALGAQ